MTVYEKVVDGVVVERVQPIDGDYTDTLLGTLVLDGDPHWRIADEDQAPAQPDDTPKPPAAGDIEDQAPADPKPKPASKRATPKE
ncbi:MAG TPA: hypothetical protein VM677_27160 [Actinokineospora sp.]|nr:hypothetical protein [Actinokineospora sp.]